MISEETTIFLLSLLGLSRAASWFRFDPKRVALTEPDAINLGRQLARTVPLPVELPLMMTMAFRTGLLHCTRSRSLVTPMN